MIARNYGKSLIKDSCIVKIDEEATAYKACPNLFAPFNIPGLKLLLSAPLSTVTSYTVGSVLLDLALRNITNVHHGIVDAHIAMEDMILLEEYFVS